MPENLFIQIGPRDGASPYENFALYDWDKATVAQFMVNILTPFKNVFVYTGFSCFHELF